METLSLTSSCVWVLIESCEMNQCIFQLVLNVRDVCNEHAWGWMSNVLIVISKAKQEGFISVFPEFLVQIVTAGDSMEKRNDLMEA